MLPWVQDMVEFRITTTTTIMITAYPSLGQFYLMILPCPVSLHPSRTPHYSIMRSSTVHARHRVSPYLQISLEDALNIIVNEIQPLGVVSLPVSEG